MIRFLSSLSLSRLAGHIERMDLAYDTINTHAIEEVLLG